MMGAVSEFFSAQLGVHVSKSLRARAEGGLPVGGVPFGYRPMGAGNPPVPDEREASAVREVFRRRAHGASLGVCAAWLNDQGFRTRNTKKLAGPDGALAINPRLFTTTV